MDASRLLSSTPIRKSFRTHQKIKRNCTKPICWVSFLLVFLLYLAYMCIFAGQRFSSSVQTIKNGSVEGTFSAAQAYLQAYCKEGDDCQQQSMEALTTILSLIQHSQFPLLQNEVIQRSSEAQKNGQAQDAVYQHGQPTINGLKYGQIQNIKQTTGHSKLIQLPLQIVKHPKVTTPATLSLGQQLKSFFTRSTPYDGIDHIVDGGNWFVWQPKTAVVSIGVRSNKQIRPTTFQIILERVQNEELTLLGVKITLQQMALLTKLQEFRVRKGINRMNCLTTECRDYYDALIFRMGEVEVSSIKVFQARKVKDVSQ